MNTLLALSLALIVGLFFSRIIRLIHLPNVTAYLVGGLLVGPSVLGLLPQDAVASLSVLTDVALGFIAYSIGAEFRLSYLRQIGSKPIVITLFEGLCAVALVDVALIAMGFPLPLCLMLGAIAAATAPAATLMVVRQYKARGPVCSMLLPVVAMDDALCLMAFSISSAIAAAIYSGEALTVQSMLISPLLQIAGSLLLGAGIGLVQALAARFFHSRGNMLSLTIAAVLGGLALCEMWGLSSLLVCMMIGAVMINLSPASNKIIEQCDRFTPPLFMLFFVLSGADLNLSVLPTVGLLGVSYLLFRSLGKWVGAFIGSSLVKAEPNVRKYLGYTLLPQAGVAIGMTQLAMQVIPEYGVTVRAVILAGTLVYELIGPVITKVALTKAGEIAPAQRA
ncbi:MAG TPA: cation:proton antiporter [Candidatus Onthenecus intestinigallinarum]|uniref:Cation:proton antiporter n=1 Tax=Candidatus Onthenecus intestinigallinarum TaxID=2840875 RepID=A0A9D1CRF8_9FIRM|nr:cation:proton antiporter [Candidatus Onthenecus intestinigallinarum]